jgi:hypothetical protein
MDTTEDIKMWLSRYTQYIDKVRDYVIQFPDTQLAHDLESQIEQLVPGTNFTGMSYQRIVTEFKDVYVSFIDWYHDFFGAKGLLSFSTSQIMDGNETLSVVRASVYSQPDNVFATDLSTDSIPIQLEQIAEWVNQKFGSIILENSCAICNQYKNQSTVIGTPVDNSTDNTTVPDNSTTDNSTIPTPIPNDVIPVAGFLWIKLHSPRQMYLHG